ncbi:Unknown protein [Striga hermonthica]|uniref:CCHC-type domain-containing protein n=1 Tax=Striga hermonthica TaxID=68872 RepID=A0A9N7R3D1_STRHE|nr:Unknown protein [Striga hermonthica]
MSFATTVPRQSSSHSSRSSRQCNVCGRSGHDTTVCFRVKVCPHCNRTGHDPRRCFEVVGYPAGWSGKSPATPSTAASSTGKGESIGTSSSSAGGDRRLIPSVSAKAHAATIVGTKPVGPGHVGPSHVGPSLANSAIQFGSYGANSVPASTADLDCDAAMRISPMTAVCSSRARRQAMASDRPRLRHRCGPCKPPSSCAALTTGLEHGHGMMIGAVCNQPP